ncbi:hypothetical protein SCUCBS95973_008426 [Sporothrix curviconia]|uniref:RNA recognition motif-containing protein n=1 Tax=Sporothrix curviconia TaxID=1260050 RepID=A0ABP0CMZ7_9PEZI
MATRPGEENVATLFGDIHYFYGPETDNPPHHRFNKGSYVYLFENAHEGRARIEIANHPGTEHQDAFDGFLDHTAVTYSYKHSCMVSLVVIAALPDQDEWHLPTYDPSNQNIYHYPLHAVDIYFWTHLDALKFVNGVRRVLPASQVDIRDEPAVPAPPPPPPPQQKHYPAPAGGPASGPATGASHGSNGANGSNGGHGAAMSHVVQKLEAVAINGGPGGSGSPPQRSGPVPAAELSFSGPPTTAVNAGDPGQQQQAAPAPTPFAYNPAAPAAPETIRPREKTPPPEDTPGQHPLHQRLYNDAATPFSPGLVVPTGLGPLSPGIPPPAMQSPPGAPSFPAPPAYSSTPPTPAAPQHPSQLGQPQLQPQPQNAAAQHPGLVRASTMPVTSPSPFNPAASFPAFSPPPTTATAPPPSSSSAANSTATPALYQPPAEAGFSSYNYGSKGATAAAGAPDFSIHHQLYRPTHGEAVSHAPKKEPRGKLEESAGRLEKGMTGMLKKFEKRFG